VLVDRDMWPPAAEIYIRWFALFGALQERVCHGKKFDSVD